MAIVKFNEPSRRAVGPLSSTLSPMLSDVFESFFNEPFFSDRVISRVPAVNIAETDDEYQIEMAAPGMQKDDFKINLENDLLTISVEKGTESEERKRYNKREYGYNSFVRTFALPNSADYEHINAEYTDGILRVDLPKREEAKRQTREISIK